MRCAFSLIALASLGVAQSAVAQMAVEPEPLIDTGSSALLILAGLIGLFGGIGGSLLLVTARTRTGASASATVAAAACLASLLWIAFGYSLAFGAGSPLIGGIGNVFLVGLSNTVGALLIPESAFVWFTLAFAVLAVALLVGGLAGRVRAEWAMLFSALWLLLVYVPIARWMFAPEGWLGALGAIDFAGGMVVHVSIGVSAYVALMALGRRRQPAAPIALVPHLSGVALIWIALAALGAGMALAATDLAASALLNLHLAAAAGALSWAGLARILPKVAKAGGPGGGALAGLAACAAGAGYLAPFGAIALGLLVGAAAAFAASKLRRIDDSANMVAIHALGGGLGSLLLVPLATSTFGGAGFADGKGLAAHLVAQAVALAIVIIWSATMTFGLVRLSASLLPMRIEDQDD